ncbi:high mobility group box domain-containing protein [Scenedesmus sp. NREL 46B-D3]|nr:high mobility group box domain-containing protein [Scenedesmus sp. NREL 46B-D3]
MHGLKTSRPGLLLGKLGNVPKKPMGAYMWFCMRARPAVTAAYPAWGVAETGRELGRLWREASGAEKQHCQRLAAADQASYAREMRQPNRT